jgi:formylglycine-generating enzyme required for sulfatase activity
MMGSPEDEQARQPDEGPQTEVTLTQGFWMGKYEVTQGEYQAVMGENPSWYNGVTGAHDFDVDLSRPVESVSWDNAVAYCEALTTQERAANRIPQGFAFSLPTEAQWEVACRAGSSTRFSYGNDPDYTELGDYAWYSGNSDGMTHPVGQKSPNGFGLYDMHGNVLEWCQDWWSDNLPGGTEVDPQGSSMASQRVIRGGCWCSDGKDCRAAYRSAMGTSPMDAGSDIGFRVVLAPARP